LGALKYLSKTVEIRKNIILSFILHATIIAAVFVISVRDTAYHVPDDYMTVSLLKEITGTTPANSQGIKRDEKNTSPEPALSNNMRFFANAQNDKGERATSDNSKGNITISLNQHVIISDETNMSHSNTKNNENNYAEAPYTPFLKREAEGDFEGKNQPGDKIIKGHEGGSGKRDISSLYALIKAAIEKAKIYPFLARKKRIEGTVITGFTINNKGYPQDIKIARSSGSEILDSAAVKIVIKAAPFPEVNGKIVVPITFKLTEAISSN
jgi:TonB family protein